MRRIYHWLYLGSKWDCGYAFPRSTQKPLLAKPPYGVRERLRRRAPAITELTNGLFARKEHVLARHEHAFHRNASGPAGDSGESLGCVGERQHDRVRYPNAGRPPPAQSRDLRKDLAQCHVFPAKNVALADPPAIKREQVRSEEHTSELQSPCNLVCRLLLE